MCTYMFTYICTHKCMYTYKRGSHWVPAEKEYGVATIRSMVWLRLVGSLKLQVSLAECSLFNRALLQKRPVILRSLLMVAPPHNTES